MKNENEKATLFIAKELLKQIEKESLQSLMWMISAINRCLLVDETMTLLEFKDFAKNVCPERFADFESIMAMKNLDVVN